MLEDSEDREEVVESDMAMGELGQYDSEGPEEILEWMMSNL